MPPVTTRTIPQLFEDAVARDPGKTWLLHEGERFTYEQARERVGRAAATLEQRGVGHGDVVFLTARSKPGYLFTWLAATYLGAIAAAVDPRGTDAEMAGLAAQLDPAVIVTDSELDDGPADALRRARPDGVMNVSALFAEENGVFEGTGPATADDAAVLIPTSGTTGRSKLVTQTHRAYVMGGEGFPWWMDLTAEDRLMTSLPLFHVNAVAYSMLGSVAAGASLVLLPAFSASTFVESAREHGATEFNAIGAMLEILMRRPERPDDADSPLRLCYTGPSPTEERQLEIEERFGLRLVCGYAMSESPYGTIWRHGERPYGTLGSIRQHPTLGTVNEGRVIEDGAPVAVGEVGELELRNPAVMKGYWGMPEETAAVLSDDGWLKTGDLVRDNGDETLTFVGRRKEVIRRRGENVAPAEIEEVLMAHPLVVEAAVVGVESDLTEEDIKAFVVLEDDAGGDDLGAIRSHAAERLTRFKVPRYVEAVSELPHTQTGRIAKHRLERDRNDNETDFEAR
jgi:crotonobetaine/carnitine-CoA ligase